MSEKLNSIYREIIEDKNFSEYAEDPDSLEDILSDLYQFFKQKKKGSFTKIIEILKMLVVNLRIPFILMLNDSDLFNSILEFFNAPENLGYLGNSEKESLIQIWKVFNSLFSKLLSQFQEIPKLSKFIFLDLFLNTNFPNSLGSKDEKAVNSKYEKIFLALMQKNLNAEKELNKILKSPNKKNEKILLEILKELNSFEQVEIFSDQFSFLERKFMVIEAQKLDDLKKKIIEIDKDLENEIYNSRSLLHNREYYMLGEFFETKNDLTTHFLDDPNIFTTNRPGMEKLFCGFLNGKGGRIYLGFDRGSVQGLNLSKKNQDTLRLEIDEIVRFFQPKVQAEECRTYFYPILFKNNEPSNLTIVKIIINPNPNEIYLCTVLNKSYMRDDSGNESELRVDEWQNLVIQRNENKTKAKPPKIIDPLPYEFDNSGYKKPMVSYKNQYFEPKNEIQPQYFNQHLFASNDKIENKSIKNHKNFTSEEKNPNISNPKKMEEDLKRILFKDDRDPQSFYDILFFKYDKNVNKEHFSKSTQNVCESVKYIAKIKRYLRRKEKGYFFIEFERELNNLEFQFIKGMYEKDQLLEIRYAKKDFFNKYREYILIK